jgi:hypothetical protein
LEADRALAQGHAGGDRLRVGHWGETGGAAEALLGARHHDVEVPRVRLERRSGERADRVHDHDRVLLVGRGGDLLHGIHDAGRRLGVDDEEDLRARGRQAAADIVRVHRHAPGRPDRRHLGARAPGDVLEEEAKAPVLDDHDAFPGFDDADHRCLHAGAAGPGYRERRTIPRPEDAAQEILSLGHQRGERGVELPDEPGSHRLENSGVGVRRPRPHEQPRGEREVSRHTAGCVPPGRRRQVRPRQVPAMLEQEPRALLHDGHDGHRRHHPEEPERLLADEDRHHH